jgi:hypothetical protein
MTMNKVINVLLLVAVLYFGWVFVVPWFKSLGTIGSGSDSRSFSDTGGGEEGKCVTAAREAAEVFSNELRSFSRPPIDAGDWDRTWLRIENRIGRADDLCSCSRPGCFTAQGALSSLHELGDEFSTAARGDGAPPVNAASTMSRVYDTLDMAAQQSRKESI